MTQRIFDIANEKDMADLWDIVPERVNKITLGDCIYNLYDKNDLIAKIYDDLIKINWHDAKEITRPVNYEDMIGCIGWFWDNENDKKTLSVLLEYKLLTGFPFITQNGSDFANFTPAKKSELKFYGE